MQISKVTGGAFLIAGTCIGAGMLALPVAMAPAGFYASLLLLILCWAIMLYTGLLVLEVNIALPRGANFISMSRATLGKSGAAVTWIAYLLLLYSLMAAYLSGGGDLLIAAFSIPNWLAPLPLIFIIAVVIFSGAKFVDYLGRIFLIGLIASYALLVTIAAPHFNFNLLNGGHVKYLFSALTIVVAAFGYHVMIPSLRDYLHDDIKKIRRTIFYGSLIPLIVYIIWELIIFAMLPRHSLMAILHSSNTVATLVKSLSLIAASKVVAFGARFFIIFAIASSFLGIAFSLFDFLADGFKIKKTTIGKLGLTLLTFVPPYIFILLYPRGFLLALSYAGIFVAILHGILPALMVWVGRKKELLKEYRVIGGRAALFLVLFFALMIVLSA